MIARVKAFLQRHRFRSLQRADYATGSKQPIENTDALVAAVDRWHDPIGGMGPTFPPDYVPPVDEGRPRH